MVELYNHVKGKPELFPKFMFLSQVFRDLLVTDQDYLLIHGLYMTSNTERGYFCTLANLK